MMYKVSAVINKKQQIIYVNGLEYYEVFRNGKRKLIAIKDMLQNEHVTKGRILDKDGCTEIVPLRSIEKLS